MSDLFVSDITNDITFRNGDLVLTADYDFGEIMLQKIKAYLLTFAGEYFLDNPDNPAVGVPYHQKFFIDKKPSLKVADHIFRNAMLSIGGVTSVEELRFVFDRPSRDLKVSFKVTASLGSVVSLVEGNLDISTGVLNR